MALIEKHFPVSKNDFDFFHHLSSQMDKELHQMEEEMTRARGLLLQLFPRDPVDVVKQEIKPSVPIVEERGETKLKLQFNVKPFKPEELEVKILGNNILQVGYLLFCYLLILQQISVLKQNNLYVCGADVYSF